MRITFFSRALGICSGNRWVKGEGAFHFSLMNTYAGPAIVAKSTEGVYLRNIAVQKKNAV
jgi:hypothetical protein